MTGWSWIGFSVIVGVILLLDLAAARRRRQPIGLYEALAWTGFWIALALGFNGAIYYLFEHHVAGSGLVPGREPGGRDAALQFFTAYLVEKSLSIGNICVIALIFAYFRLRLEQQHRVLGCGMSGAVVLRASMILGGIALIGHFAWMSYVFGTLLIAGAVYLLLHHDEVRPGRSLLVRLCGRFYPSSGHLAGDSFFVVRGDGRRAATPLLLALLMVEGANLGFAIDSIPAAIAVTREPFLILGANLFAILGLRPLYFALAGLLDRLRYLRLSLVFLLFSLGIKLLLDRHYPLPIEIALPVIAAIIAAGVLLSSFVAPRAAAPVSPLADDLGALFTLTIRGARRIIVLVIGSTVVLIGLAMIVLPGPAVVVIPAGLAILATEFIWARRLLHRLRHETRHLADSAKGFFGRRKADAPDVAAVEGTSEKKRGG